MRRLLLSLFVPLAFLACDSANPVAPSGSVLTLTASPSQIGLDGVSTITVQGFRPDGNALFPGTQIQVTTSLGSLSASLVEIGDSGRGTVTLSGDGRTGTATVTAALAASDASATVDVLIGESDETRPSVVLTASPAIIGLNERSTIRVRARQADGSPYPAGGRVELSTSLGALEDDSVVTDANGEASTILDAGGQPGTAEITGTLGSSEVATLSVTIENRRPQLLISANPDSIPAFGTSTITILARDNTGTPLGAGHRIQLFANLGSIPDEIVTNSAGRAEATYTAGGEPGTATIQAVLGTSEVVSTTIDIRDAAADVAISANPTNINFGDATINLRALVRNAQNQAIPNINVTFVSDVGTFETTGGQPSTGTVRTNTQGEADIVLQVTQDDLGTRNSFVVTASVLSEGQTVQNSVTITVNRN